MHKHHNKSDKQPIIISIGSSDDNCNQMAPAAGRSDTRAIEAASAVGYDGAAMRCSVDKALNQNDARNAEQQKAIGQATGK
jgi:hypothetical protein